MAERNRQRKTTIACIHYTHCQARRTIFHQAGQSGPGPATRCAPERSLHIPPVLESWTYPFRCHQVPTSGRWALQERKFLDGWDFKIAEDRDGKIIHFCRKHTLTPRVVLLPTPTDRDDGYDPYVLATCSVTEMLRTKFDKRNGLSTDDRRHPNYSLRLSPERDLSRHRREIHKRVAHAQRSLSGKVDVITDCTSRSLAAPRERRTLPSPRSKMLRGGGWIVVPETTTVAHCLPSESRSG